MEVQAPKHTNKSEVRSERARRIVSPND
jgi:hypothetical protein